MQVTKSNQYCSSILEQETRNHDVSDGTTVIHPQMSWIPRSSRPGNPSWLSTYQITIPEKTKPVLSVDNPGSSGIAEARPSPVSDEPGCSPESRLAKTSVVQKKKEPGTAQETAAAVSEEETRFVLSIASQSDFRIEKARPVPIPIEFLHLERDLDKISALYRSDNLAEAKENAIGLLETLAEKPEAEPLIQYLNTVVFLCHVMQDMTFCHDLPANNSAEFIHWMITIAEAARQESDDLPASSKLMLFCLRWAADAGAQGARQYLVKVLLFRQLCPDMPSPNVHFFPVEALEHLVNMARDDTQPPIPKNEQDNVINSMVELIKSRNTENPDSRKKELVDFLRHHSQPEIQLLIPFIYTSDVFGPPEYDKAREYLEQFPAPDAGESVSSPVCDVYQFWKLMCTMVPQAFHEAGTVEELNQLVQKGFLAAIHLLSELSREHEDISPSLVSPFIQSPEPGFTDYPCLTHSLCKFYFEKIKQKNGANKQGLQEHAEEMLNNVKDLLRNAGIQGDSRMRDNIIWSEIRSIFNRKNLRNAGRESVPALPEETVKLLQNSQYTQDPAALIYIHCAQVLRHGKADEKLIEAAERRDALSTYFHMLMISDATEEMDSVVLVNKLLDIPYIKIQDFQAWEDHQGLATFINNLFSYSPVCRNPEACDLLCLDFLDFTSKMNERGTGRARILNSLAENNRLQGNIKKANQYYRQAWELQDPSERDEAPRHVCESSVQIMRTDLPEYYYQLLSIHEKSFHPLETLCKFNRLLSVWENMQENKDPSLWDAWIIMSCTFIIYSRWHITPEMCQTLINNTAFAIKKQRDLSFGQLLAASGQLYSMVSNLENKCKVERTSDVAELIADARKLKEAVSNQAPPHLKADNTDKTARLPNTNITKAYIVQHHILAEVQKAKSIDNIIRHMKQLTTEHYIDSATFIRVLAPWFDSTLPLPEHTDDIIDILLLLQKTLDKQLQEISEFKFDSKCRLMVAMHVYCHEFIGNANQTINNIAKRMNDQKTTLIIKHPEHVVANIVHVEKEFNDRQEYNAICWALLTEKSSIKFNALLKHAIKLHPPRLVLKLFNKLFIKDEAISKLEELKNEYGNISHILELIVYQIKGMKKEVLPFLQANMQSKSLNEEQKVRLLWYAYESLLITDKESIKHAMTLIKRLSKHMKLFVQVLIEDSGNVGHSGRPVSFARIHELERCYQEGIGFKLLSSNINQAADIWCISDSGYPLAMLAWRHKILPNEVRSIDVGQTLQRTARNGEVKASCELVRWILEQQRDGKEISPELKRDACRSVHLPHPMAGAESVLYQGITQYLGFAGKPDLMTGKQKIQEALDKDPLIVALRLYDLKEQKLFTLHDDPTDYLLRYAQALSKRDKDQYNRRDNYFNNLLLSYGNEALQKLLVSLHGKAGSDPSNKPVHQQATHRLSEWLGQWPWAAATPAAASQRTSRSRAKAS